LHCEQNDQDDLWYQHIFVHNSDTQTYWSYVFPDGDLSGGFCYSSDVKVSDDGMRVVAAIRKPVGLYEKYEVYFLDPTLSAPIRIKDGSSIMQFYFDSIKELDISGDGNLLFVRTDHSGSTLIYDYNLDSVIKEVDPLLNSRTAQHGALSNSGNIFVHAGDHWPENLYKITLYEKQGNSYPEVSEIVFSPSEGLSYVAKIEISEDDSTLVVADYLMITANEAYKLVLRAYDITDPSNPNLIYHFVDDIIDTRGAMHDISVSENGELVAIGRSCDDGGGSSGYIPSEADELMVFSIPDNQLIYSKDYYSSSQRFSGAGGVQFFDDDNKLYVYHEAEDDNDDDRYSIFNIDYGGTTPTQTLPPTNLNAQALSDSEIQLTWTASSSAGVTGYKIFPNTNCGGSVLAQVSGTQFLHSGLNEGTSYTYSIKAVTSSEESVCSGSVSATTQQSSSGGGVPTVTLDYTNFFAVSSGSSWNPNYFPNAFYSFGHEGDKAFFANDLDFKFYSMGAGVSDPFWEEGLFTGILDADIIGVDSSSDGTIHVALYHVMNDQDNKNYPTLYVYNSETQNYWSYTLPISALSTSVTRIKISEDGSRIVISEKVSGIPGEYFKIYFFSPFSSGGPTRVIGSSSLVSGGLASDVKDFDISEDGDLVLFFIQAIENIKVLYDYNSNSVITEASSDSYFVPIDAELSSSGNLFAYLTGDVFESVHQILIHSKVGNNYPLVSEIRTSSQDMSSYGQRLLISKDESTLVVVGMHDASMFDTSPDFQLVLKAYDITNPENPILVYNFVDDEIATSSMINDVSISENGELFAVARRGGNAQNNPSEADELMVFSIPFNQLIYSQDYYSGSLVVTAAKGVQFFDNDNKLFVYHVADDNENEYYYSVFNINSNDILPQIEAPTNLNAFAVSDSKIRLDWPRSLGDGVVGYKIYRGNCDVLIEEVNSEVNYFYDENLNSATVYDYSVKSITSWGESPCPATVSATTNSGGVIPGLPSVNLDYSEELAGMNADNKFSMGEDSNLAFFRNIFGFKFYSAEESVSGSVWEGSHPGFYPYDHVLEVDSSSDGRTHAVFTNEKNTLDNKYYQKLYVYDSVSETYWSYTFPDSFISDSWIRDPQSFVDISSDGSRIVVKAVTDIYGDSVSESKLYFFSPFNENYLRIVDASFLPRNSLEVNYFEVSSDARYVWASSFREYEPVFIYDFDTNSVIKEIPVFWPNSESDDYSESANILATTDREENFGIVRIYEKQGQDYFPVSEIETSVYDIRPDSIKLLVSQDDSILVVVGERFDPYVEFDMSQYPDDEESYLIVRAYDISNPSDPFLISDYVSEQEILNFKITDVSLSENKQVLAVASAHGEDVNSQTKELLVFSVPFGQLIFSEDYYHYYSYGGGSIVAGTIYGLELFEDSSKLFTFHTSTDPNTNDGNYYYSVYSITPGSGGPITILPPTNLDAETVSDTEIRLSWTRSQTNGVTGYKIFQDASCNNLIEEIGNLNYHHHAGLLADTTYDYTLKAVHPTLGDSSCSTSASATTNPAEPSTIDPPTNLVASDGYSNVDLTWVAPPLPTGFLGFIGAGDFTYRVYRNTVNNPLTATEVVHLENGEIEWTDFEAASGVKYYYWVKAYYEIFGILNIISSGFSIGDFGFSLGVATNVQASDGTYADKIRVSWDSVAGATQYYLSRNTIGAACNGQTFGIPASHTSYDDFSVNPDVTYYYSVRANSDAGLGQCSEVDVGSIGTGGPVGPGVPTNVQASDDVYNDKIVVSWNRVTGARGYAVYRSESDEGCSGSYIARLAGRSYHDNSVVPGTTYYYSVKTISSTGQLSECSETDSGSSFVNTGGGECGAGHTDNGDGTCTAVFFVDASDGQIYKEGPWSVARNSEVGDWAGTTGYGHQVGVQYLGGVDNSYRIRRAFFPFSNYDIPVGAVVSSAKLNIGFMLKYGEDNLEIMKGTQGSSLTVEDYNDCSSTTSMASVPFTNFVSGEIEEIDLDVSGFLDAVSGSNVYLCIRSGRDFNDDNSEINSNGPLILLDSGEMSNRPFVVVDYALQ